MSDITTARDETKAEQLADAYRDEILPQWEAVYDSATFTPRLLAYCNDEVAARGAAEAWLLEHCTDAAGLVWTPDPQMAAGDWDRWLSLSQTAADGTPLDTEIVVRRRAARTASAQEQ